MRKDYYELTSSGRTRRLRALARLALEEFGIEARRLRAMTDATNGVFRVDAAAGRRLALRVGLGPPTGKSKALMMEEIRWMRDLAARADVVIPVPQASSSGAFIVTVSGEDVPHERHCALFSWLEGPLIADRVSAPTFELLGAAMARLHGAALEYEARAEHVHVFDTVYPYGHPFIVFEQAGADLLPRRRRAVFEAAHEHVVEGLAALSAREPPRLIHGDLHGWNSKINRGVVSVFDFEDMVLGWPVQDIATTLYYFWSRDDFAALWSAFRAGYERIAPWPDHGGEVATFIKARTLIMANDVLRQPEWLDVAPEVYERGERRIRAMNALG